MEELLPENETAEIDIFGVDVGEYIRAKLPDAIARVFITAPVHLLEGKECKDVLFPEKRQDGSGRVIFPEKVLRVLSFKMKGWNRPVTRFINSCHEKSELQYMSASDRVVLDYYSLPASLRVHEVDSAVYVPVPEMQDGGYDVPVRLADAVGYVCAAMVYEILGQPDMAAQMAGRVVLPEL